MSREKLPVYPYTEVNICKILLSGDAGVGKSKLMERFVDGTWNEAYEVTIGVNFKIQLIEVDGRTFKLQLWDTAGPEGFRAITQSYYRGSDIVYLVYDITRRDTFNNLRTWMGEITHYSPTVKVVLVGTKLDLPEKRQVSTSEAQQYALQNGISKFFEVSCKTGKNVVDAFIEPAAPVCKQILEKSKAKTSSKNYF